MTFWPENWDFLVPNAPMLELIVRGTAIYFFLYVLMLIAGRRLFGRFAMSDILVLVVLAVTVGDGITGGFSTVGDAIVSATTVFAWDMAIDWLAFRFPRLRGPLRHDPTPIIRDGRLLAENARANLLTRAEIMEKLRENGVGSIEEVREARLEPDGDLSVIRAER